MTATATAPKKLTAAEQKQLQTFLDKAGLVAVNPGEGLTRYQCLTNVSVAVRDKQGHKTDKNRVASAGETVELDEEEARNLLNCGPGSGRRHPAIRKVEDSREPLPRLVPRQLSGTMRQPPASPPPNYTGPRQDPEGSSHLLETGPPEAQDPQTEAWVPADGEPVTDGPDAVDIPPSGRGAAAVAQLSRQ